jgi:hypothetical protein
MGANAQTTVPTFTAAQVLTFDQMNQSARTGVPVFADTTARDAAFGGSGEKTLAEGQLCYLESTDVVQYYDGAAWATLGPTATAGLTLISTTTIGTTVASVTVTGAFSSTYDNYRIIVNGGVASTTSSMQMQLGATTTGYYDAGSYVSYNGATVNVNANSNAASWLVGQNTTDSLDSVVDLRSPNLAKNTHFSAQFSRSTTTGPNWNVGGYVANTTQYTAFTLSPNTGTLTGGTIRVYGYRN